MINKCEICRQKLYFLQAHKFYQCKTCGIHSSQIKKVWSVEGSCWEGNYLHNYLSGEHWRRKVFTNRLHLLSLFTKGEKLLDIGSAAGLFIDEANRFGYNASGVETDNQFREYSCSINPDTKHFSSINKIHGEKFDCITIFDTLGYCMDISNFLTHIAGLLSDHGILMVSAGAVQSNLQDIKDWSFNYYFDDIFWDRTVPDNFGLNLIKRFKEAKTFNTQEYGSKSWWRDYLKIDTLDYTNYILYLKA